MQVLRPGSYGSTVELLQLALNRAGFGELETDGIFGAATRFALMGFQRANGLAADGIAGAQTQRALQPWYTGYLIHPLRRGETLYSLSQRYGSPLEAILLANPELVPERIPVGTQVVVPLPFDVVPVTISWSSDLVAFCVRGLAARYPFVTPGHIGSSVLGRPLWSLRLGAGENRVLYTASHHANEWITTPLLLRFAEQLCAAFAAGESLGGASAAELLDHSTLVLIPAVNPDGIDLVTGALPQGAAYAQALAIAAAYPRFPFPSGWKANIRGTDLNLQYPAGWEQAKINKAAQGIRSPAPADYVGPSPLSAPESRAMYAFTQSFSPDLTQAWHTQGRVIYWRFLDHEPAGAQAIAESFASVSGYAVDDAPYASGFAGYKDWFVQDFDRPGFTIEAGQGQNPLPLSQFEEIYRDALGILTLGLLAT